MVQSVYFLNPKLKASSCAAPFVSDLVGIPEDMFTRDATHIQLTTT